MRARGQLIDGFRERVFISLVVIAVLTTATSAWADDKISINYRSAPHASSGTSSEFVMIEINRAPPYTEVARQRLIDQYFASVKQVLQTYDVSKDWLLSGPDIPIITISMELDGKKLSLASSHTLTERDSRLVTTSRGTEALEGRDKANVLAQQSLEFRQYRVAFEQLLRLSSDHLRATLAF